MFGLLAFAIGFIGVPAITVGIGINAIASIDRKVRDGQKEALKKAITETIADTSENDINSVVYAVSKEYRIAYLEAMLKGMKEDPSWGLKHPK
jgi:hypothetical protein